MNIFPSRYATTEQDGSQYFVLLIITDGVISDMAQTKEAIVNVSSRGSAHLRCHQYPAAHQASVCPSATRSDRQKVTSSKQMLLDPLRLMAYAESQ